MGSRGRGAHRSARGGKRQRFQKNDFRRSNRPDTWIQDKEGGGGSKKSFGDVVSNEAFEAYYRAQGIVDDADGAFERDFMAALRRPLPLTFRVNGTGPFAAELRAELEAGFEEAGFGGGRPLVVGGGGDGGDGGGTIGDVIEPPKALPWYPDRLAWQLNTSRDALRRSKPLAALHAALVQEHEGGRVTRQEAVSMIPPLLLSPEPHHLVLDACASPGSKTAQLIEAVGRSGDAGFGGRGADPAGAVVANDRDAKRCNMLCHQVKRLASPALLVTCHDASTFPVPGPRGCSVRSPEALLFDRVLADVPCSGDGTMRKAPDLWRRWSPNLGLGLHPLQLRIGLRCAALTSPRGGRLVYSTCSLNPVEDEAVVAAMLLRAGGALRLVDARGMLPGLETSEGLSTWKVPSKYDGKKGPGGVVPASGVRLWDSIDEAEGALPNGRAARGLKASMFAPTATNQEEWEAQWEREERRRVERASNEAAAEGEEGKQKRGPAPAAPCPRATSLDGATKLSPFPLNLHYCIRVLPHSNDTGGFFIALLEKVAHIPEIERTGGGKKRKEGGVVGDGADGAAAPGKNAKKRAAEGEAGEDDEGGEDGEENDDEDDDVDPVDGVDEDGGDAAAAATTAAAAAAPGPRPRTWGGADPMVELFDAACFPRGAETAEGIRAYYGIPDAGNDSPDGSGPVARLFARVVDGVSTPKRLFTVSEGVRALLRADRDGRLKVTAAGVKTFERQEAHKGEGAAGADDERAESGARRLACPYRVTHDGLALLAPLLTRQVIRPTPLEMLALLEGRAVALAEGGRVGLREKEEEEGEKEEEKTSDATAPAPQKQHKHAGLWEDDATISEVAACAIGGVVVCLRPGDASSLGLGETNSALATACWRGRASIQVHVNRNESMAFAKRLRAALEAKGVELPAPPPPPPSRKTGSGRDRNNNGGGGEGAAGAGASAPPAAAAGAAPAEKKEEEEALEAAAA